MSTPKMTLGFGGMLMGLGVGAYAFAATRAGSGGASKTALIPAAYGAVFLGLGMLAQQLGASRPVLGTATALAGAGGIGMSAMVLAKLRRGAPVNPRALTVQATTALLSLGYAVLGAGGLTRGHSAHARA